MSLRITIDISDQIASQLEELGGKLKNKDDFYARIAGEAERWIKSPEVAGKVTGEQHRTANRLGAKPTGHLEGEFEGIDGVSDGNSASLLIPAGGRLRAAFGDYTIKPGAGKYYLTIPVDEDSYGKKAGQFDDLFVRSVRSKSGQSRLVLARRPERVETGSILNRSRKGKRYDKSKPLEVLYVLVKEAKIPEDRNLIPFDELEEISALAAGDYLDDEIDGRLA